MALRRLLCASCNSELFAWGRTKSGKRRWYCKICKISRIYHLKRRKLNVNKLFRQYVLWGLTYEMLSSNSNYSIQYLALEFHKLLKLDPPKLSRIKQADISDRAYLLIDGLWFGRWFVLLVYRQSKTLFILHISVAGRESQTKIAKDLKHIKNDLKYKFSGTVTDGGTAICSAINEVYSHLPHQICLAHMHRDILSALGRFSKNRKIQELISLANHIWLIESHEALNFWQGRLKDWFFQNLSFLRETHKDETGRVWFVHTGVRKALRIMMRLSRTSFTFLDHHGMPKTTNEIEATFGHLGQRWLRHKGLKKERWESFLKWFVYYYNLEKMNKTDNKTK